ncbi:HipA N-terminal domain-containing protein [Pontibacter sp. JH31]|uniref:HipA N-terminal domain-containing protein n=1 Tax=Pontibacter aquaedesilientis TaxID=2766980 RepID=A0ABR7XBU9_9BACT|nr:HipA N-terminal domain-containing protein [Pontibacter aquaedesilientis]MBD1395767.1 HipA N-terminal domain-containing protein [Pontibacter aquaedesilientis]
MRQAGVYRNGTLAGLLTQYPDRRYEFRYTDEWFQNSALPAISLTLPKTEQVYLSDHLFPFFFNMLSEGVNRQLQARQLKIDEKDYFGLLLATAGADTIGAVTVKPLS